MAKARSLETKLARLRELSGQPHSPQLIKELAAGLRDSSNFVVADAAELIGKGHSSELAPNLVEAFTRFLDKPLKKDPQCRARIALVEALNQLEFNDENFYLRGVHYVQAEPVWAGTRDTAVPIRVACASSLVRLRHPEAMPLLVDMLATPYSLEAGKALRVGAAQVLTYAGTVAAALLLRLKVRLGDPEEDVISECFTGILEITKEPGVPFVTEYLASGNQALQEAALLALGSSRQVAAFGILKSFAVRCIDEIQETAHVALALLRLPAATDFLLSLVTDPSPTVAENALKALAVHRYDPRIRERTADAVAQNGTAALRELLAKRFGVKE